MKIFSVILMVLIYGSLFLNVGCVNVNSPWGAMNGNSAALGIGSGTTHAGGQQSKRQLTARERRMDALQELGYTPWQTDVIMGNKELRDRIILNDIRAEKITVFQDGTFEMKEPQ